MLGAIIGDIVGSRFEWNNHRNKEFDLFTNKCFPTDDSIMTLSVAKAILESKEDFSDLSEKTKNLCKKLVEIILIVDMEATFFIGYFQIILNRIIVMVMEQL